MSAHVELTKQSGQRTIWFNSLLLLDAFVVGGLAAMWLVYRELTGTMNRLIKIEAQQEIDNVIDHLMPYWFFYAGIALLLVAVTLGALLWHRMRSRGI